MYAYRPLKRQKQRQAAHTFALIQKLLKEDRLYRFFNDLLEAKKIFMYIFLKLQIISK